MSLPLVRPHQQASLLVAKSSSCRRGRAPAAHPGVRRDGHQQLVRPTDGRREWNRTNQGGVGSQLRPLHHCSQIRRCVDPLTHCVRYYTPRGRFVHIPPAGPSSDWDTDFGRPWWTDERYQVGRLSAKTRWIRVVNMLTSQEQKLQVSPTPEAPARPLAKASHPEV